jgi:hypothetical protein
MIFCRIICPFHFVNNMKFSVSVHYLPNGITHSTQIWHMDKSKECAGQVLVIIQWFSAQLCPFHFENNMKFSVSVHYLPNSVTYATQIWHMDKSKECAGQVRIWPWFYDFWHSYVPFTLKIIINFQFPFIISSRVLQIQLKVEIWICQRNT